MTMSTQAHLDFYVRSLFQLTASLSCQLPPSYDIHIDHEVFLSAFTVHTGDHLIKAMPWELGPDSAMHQMPDPSTA